jgi:hypothetical protein
MAFGISPGPPATQTQLRQLLALVHAAGYTDFRDARGPLGLSQRQAGGRFTSDEAAAMIDTMESASDGSTVPAAERARLSVREQALRKLPDEVLAEELHRRGWIVIAP